MDNGNNMNHEDGGFFDGYENHQQAQQQQQHQYNTGNINDLPRLEATPYASEYAQLDPYKEENQFGQGMSGVSGADGASMYDSDPEEERSIASKIKSGGGGNSNTGSFNTGQSQSIPYQSTQSEGHPIYSQSAPYQSAPSITNSQAHSQSHSLPTYNPMGQGQGQVLPSYNAAQPQQSAMGGFGSGPVNQVNHNIERYNQNMPQDSSGIMSPDTESVISGDTLNTSSYSKKKATISPEYKDLYTTISTTRVNELATSDRATLTQLMERWVNLDTQMKMKDDEKKVLKIERDQLTPVIREFMQYNKIPEIPLEKSGGKIHYAKRTSKNKMTPAFIRQCLGQYIPDRIALDRATKDLMDPEKLGKKETYVLVRQLDKSKKKLRP